MDDPVDTNADSVPHGYRHAYGDTEQDIYCDDHGDASGDVDSYENFYCEPYAECDFDGDAFSH